MSRCARAIAYIKRNIPKADEDAAPVPATGTIPRAEYPVVTEYTQDFSVCYLYDAGQERSLSYIQHQDLIDDGLGQAELHRLAVANIAKQSDEIAISKQDGPFYIVSFDPTFTASLILHDALWDATLVGDAPNGYVLAIPSRQFIAFCDRNCDAGIQKLHEFVDAILNHDCSHPITTTLYTRDFATRSWVPFE